ncbi:uncharacterized protein LOC121867046 isoform X1 [Homarus americanus]|uniref:uncharacterized protein LOC121867046 isoform X1 n=1 Tax=Homarus americanus TaxID=6706 RepID=UPI001C48F70C|nr:uncharacterized protein LOC121867046 isoform X1 [Homarus americanus]
MNRSWAVLLFTLVLVAVVSRPVQGRRLKPGRRVPEYCQFVRVDCTSVPLHECCGIVPTLPPYTGGPGIPEYCNRVTVICDRPPYHECCGRRQTVPEICSRSFVNCNESPNHPCCGGRPSVPSQFYRPSG